MEKRVEIYYDYSLTKYVKCPINITKLIISNCMLRIFDCELPSSLIYLNLSCNVLKKFNSVLPKNLISLNLNYNLLTTFNVKIPNNMQEILLMSNNLVQLNLIIPKSLKVLKLKLTYNFRIKKIKLNKICCYDKTVKNNKTLNKALFYLSKF